MYERLCRIPFSMSSRQVDEMEIWEVVSILGLDRDQVAPLVRAVGAETATGRKIDDRALILARMEAARRGDPEPLHIFGDRDS